FLMFFFSSRRRHTRFSRDWSSDVCSSDLVGRGEMLGVIGPNGAGKTTLFNLVSGIHRPTSGSVLLEGADVTTTSVAARARAGLRSEERRVGKEGRRGGRGSRTKRMRQVAT